MIGLITKGIEMVGGYFTKRQEIKAKKQERQDRVEEAVTTAQIANITQGNNSAAKLDEISIKQRGWKDDYLLIITTLPVILAFVPDMVAYIEAGFAALNTIPEYYWYALAMIYIDTFGFRRMVRTAFEHWLEKRFRGT